MKEKEESMKVTNKLNIITLHWWKVALTITIENEILDFVLYNMALSNIVTSNEIIDKLWSIDEKYMKNHGVYFRNGVILLCNEII